MDSILNNNFKIIIIFETASLSLVIRIVLSHNIRAFQVQKQIQVDL